LPVATGPVIVEFVSLVMRAAGASLECLAAVLSKETFVTAAVSCGIELV